jgi:predicted short-subunit dehydrogenase-like oxidoreductase (DUF2520 family)
MKISILGSGNIASFFAKKLLAEGFMIHQIISEKVNRASELANQVNAQVVVNVTGLDEQIDALIIAIPDDEIKKNLLHINCVVIHCSGTCTLQDLATYSDHVGCIWPIYSITKAQLPAHKNIPFVVNHNSTKAQTIVEKIANCLSTQVCVLNDEQKAVTHLCATISNNFSNHLFTIAQTICQEHAIPFALLIPILELTINKLHHTLPANNQTGPALRGDTGTMQHHTDLLQPNDALIDLYKKMSALIQEYHHQKK